MPDRIIGKALCSATMRAEGPDGGIYEAGVLRLDNVNQIILVRILEDEDGEREWLHPADPSLCPETIRRDPRFNAWGFATVEETDDAIHGRRPSHPLDLCFMY